MFGYFIIHADWHLDTELHVIYLFIKTKCEDLISRADVKRNGVRQNYAFRLKAILVMLS